MYLPNSKTVIITKQISTVDSTLEGANENRNFKSRQKDLTDVDGKAREDTNVGRESITLLQERYQISSRRIQETIGSS